jgi:hypothetical protein
MVYFATEVAKYSRHFRKTKVLWIRGNYAVGDAGLFLEADA